MDRGWIKLYRKIQDSPLYKDCNSKQRDVLITILLMVNHKPNIWIFQGQEYEVKSGQVITSLDKIAQYCAKDVSIQNIRTALLKFEKYGFITNRSTNKNRLIEVVNWDIYQNDNSILTSKTTHNEQTINIEVTPNKKVRTKEKIIYTRNSIEYQLAEYLYNSIASNDPNFKKPNFNDWANQIAYLIKQEERKVDDIKAVIDWTQRNSFWSGIITDAKKFRNKYSQLFIQMNSDKYEIDQDEKHGKILKMKVGDRIYG